ncbi:MAG: Gfo/Idh/MocA family oxidoreductase [Planctomycetes bacterium]|nr:Gfo/Idh/MocA family oxidoreductase [Planctomycetota bacterium]
MNSRRSKRAATVSRREFLKSSAAAAGAAIAWPVIVPSSVFGAGAPSNRITMGCIGLGGQGTGNMKGFRGKSGCEVVAVCDADAGHRERARQIAGLAPAFSYTDFREVLARDDIDAVSVAAPDHWHVPISIAAVRSGKDVFCEKPLTLTIGEGRVLADEARRYGRVFQTGSQQRSGSEFRFACELVRNGRIGKLHTMRVGIHGNNRKCPPTWEAEPVPEGFDYDMWLGPAPREPYTTQRCHYQFRFILDYSEGQMTNWGAHYLDIAQWGNGADDTGPVEIVGRGDFPKTGLFTTAQNEDIEYTYANGVKLFLKSGSGHTRFEGTQGWVDVTRNKINAEPKSLLTSVIGPDEIHLYESKDHKQNFLDCIKSRKDTICTAEIGHRSASVCHLGNIAMKLGRKLKWDPKAERFINDSAANNMLTRAMRAPWKF